MITDISIENFKILKSISLKDMKRVTLISGKNNIGKSTLLEAIFLYMDHSSGESFGKLNGFRGTITTGAEGLWEPIFYQMNTDNPITITVTDDNNVGILKYSRDNNYLPTNINGISEGILAQFRADTKASYSLAYSYTLDNYKEEGHFSLNNSSILRDINSTLLGNEIMSMKPTRFINALFIREFSFLVNEFGRIELSGEKKDLIEALQEMDESIEDVITLSVRGLTQLYLRVNGQLMPLHYAGDGITKLMSICLAIMDQKNGVVLVDELETGLHYSIYGKLWKIINSISQKSNCQVIATTHSYEMISAIRGEFNNTDDFCYYRIGNTKDNLNAYRYSYSMLDSALESEMEVR